MSLTTESRYRQQIITALEQVRLSRHSADCHCGAFKDLWCSADERIWCNSVDRILDHITSSKHAA